MAVRDLPAPFLIASLLVVLPLAEGRAAPKKTSAKPHAVAPAPRVTIRSLESAPVRRVARRGSLALAPGMGRRDAFSPAPMQSKARLLQCLRGDARYRKNLARHFGVSETKLVSYVDENVQVFRLKEDMKSDVYAVTRSGRRYRVAQRLPKGLLVFGLPGGYVMMKSNCGNPVIASLPPVPAPAPIAAAPLPPPPTIVPLPATEVAGVQEELPAVLPPALPPAIPPVTGSLPVVPEGRELAALTPVIVGEPAVGQLDSFPGVRSAPARRGGGFPWWLGGLGGLAFIDGGDDDDNGGPPIIPPPIVPEPSSAVLVVSGGAVLLLFSRKRK